MRSEIRDYIEHMYIHREIESTILEMLRQFKVVLVTGARQVGKTTMLGECLGGKCTGNI